MKNGKKNENLSESFKEILEDRKQAFQKTLEDKNCYEFEYESSIELSTAASNAEIQSNLLFPSLENFTQNQATKECHIILKESYKLKIYGNNNFKNFQKATNQITNLAQNFNITYETKKSFSWLDIGHKLIDYGKAFFLGIGKGVLEGTKATIDMVIHPIETIENLANILYEITKITIREFSFYAHQSLIISDPNQKDKDVIEALGAINHKFIFYKDNLERAYNLSKICCKNYYENHSGSEILQDSTEFISKTLTEIILPGKALKASKFTFKFVKNSTPILLETLAKNSKKFRFKKLKKFLPERVYELENDLKLITETSEKIKFQTPSKILKQETIINEISEISRLRQIEILKTEANIALKNLKPIPRTDLVFKDLIKIQDKMHQIKRFSKTTSQFKNYKILELRHKYYLNMCKDCHKPFSATKKYLKSLKLDLAYDGKIYTAHDWPLGHVFCGDLQFGTKYPPSGLHYLGFKSIDKIYKYEIIDFEKKITKIDLFSHNGILSKESTIFPRDWSPKKCIEKSIEAFKNKTSRLKDYSENGKSLFLLFTKTKCDIDIKFVFDLKTKKLTTFYPIFSGDFDDLL